MDFVSDPTVEKSRLSDVKMYVNRMRGGYETTYDVLCLRVKKFSELEESIDYIYEYSNMIHEYSNKIYLFKAKKTLIFTVHAESGIKISCFVVYRRGKFSKPFSAVAVKKNGNKYQVRIPLKFVGVLQNDILEVSFVFFIRQIVLSTVPCRNVNYFRECSRELNEDFKRAGSKGLIPADFLIQTSNEVYQVNRDCLITARSQFFNNYVKEKSEIKLECTEEVLQEVPEEVDEKDDVKKNEKDDVKKNEKDDVKKNEKDDVKKDEKEDSKKEEKENKKKENEKKDTKKKRKTTKRMKRKYNL